jgi:hypothetical protein
MLVKRNFFFSKEECEEIIVLCEKVGVKTIHKIDAYNKWDILPFLINKVFFLLRRFSY